MMSRIDGHWRYGLRGGALLIASNLLQSLCNALKRPRCGPYRPDHKNPKGGDYRVDERGMDHLYSVKRGMTALGIMPWDC